MISADIPVVGRRKPGDPIRFTAVDVPEAERLRREAEAEFEALVARLSPVKPAGGLDAARLFEMNLISGVVFDEA
nr:allophanate hydrolase [uncultured bacterium]